VNSVHTWEGVVKEELASPYFTTGGEAIPPGRAQYPSGVVCCDSAAKPRSIPTRTAVAKGVYVDAYGDHQRKLVWGSTTENGAAYPFSVLCPCLPYRNRLLEIERYIYFL
jgi:hypothetical protein